MSPAWRACEKPPGSGPRGGENDAPRRGKVAGEESLASWATPRAGGSALQLPWRGAHALSGRGGCPIPRKGVTAPSPRQTVREWAGPRRHPSARSGLAPSSLLSDRAEEHLDGRRGGGKFLAKVGTWGLTEALLPDGALSGGGPGVGGPRGRVGRGKGFRGEQIRDQGFNFLPASLPCSFIQHRSDLCWALEYSKHVVGVQ